MQRSVSVVSSAGVYGGMCECVSAETKQKSSCAAASGAKWWSERTKYGVGRLWRYAYSYFVASDC